ncbi:secreted RxLR effector protein 78-like [Nicotiana tabacum]|uniref:Secreted RxLR effector protein 78-like n=1 Tax=Nicotiana tabacum TaxID=4097 RepID=A0AC58S5K8_TOBAC
MSFIISEAQAGFIPGRRIADNIILAHELVKSYSRKHISPRCMIKVDLQKAYDSVEWAYLEQVLEGLAFPEKFTKWIMVCVRTVNYTILLNGETVEPFNAVRGLRQGDPISPSFLQLQWST